MKNQLLDGKGRENCGNIRKMHLHSVVNAKKSL